jgi:tetratricopeptide (TPR) repeat protein
MKLLLKISLFLCGLVFSCNTWGINYTQLDSGNAYYTKSLYDKAIANYNKFIMEGNESAQAYFNLGNCYYRKSDMAYAILNYEKAKKLAPSDPDIQFNLQIANLKTTDKISPDASSSISNWWRGFVDTYSERGWAIICIVCFCICLLLLGVYFMARNLLFKQLGFWVGMVMLLVSVTTFVFSYEQYSILTSHDTAIVISNSVTVTGAPTDNATKLFVIHEGAKVWIVKTEGNYTEIKLANGNQGWLLTSDISEI